MPNGYLIDIPEREQEAVRRFLKLPPFIPWEFFGSLGLNFLFSWFLLQIKKDHLLKSSPGDVDILAGRLNWSNPKEFESILAEEANIKPEYPPNLHNYCAALKLANSGGIMWPPSTGYLVGIEAKCAYLQISENAVKSTKSSLRKVRHLRAQIENLLRMGFDRVALLDIIANPLASGTDGQAWLAASSIAITSIEKMFPVLKERLPEDSPAGHWVVSIGSVIGGYETMRGTVSPNRLRIAQENLFLQRNTEVQSRRQEMEDKLNSILTNLSLPRSFPVVLIDCNACGKIHMEVDICNKVQK